MYAVQVDASEGFELCPADACNVEEKFCPTNPDGNKFMIVKDYNNLELKKYEDLLKSNNIEIAGIEYIKGKDGNIIPMISIQTQIIIQLQRERVI